MMITELRSQNFKSWQDTGKLQFAPLTGLFGANSSGKTSILQVLLMLKQTVEQPSDWNEPLYFGDETSLVNLGNFDAVIHRHERDLSLDISVSWKAPEKLATQSSIRGDIHSFSASISKDLIAAFCYMGRRYRYRVWPITQTNNTSDGYNVSSPYGEDSARSLFRYYGIRDVSEKTQRIFSDLEKTFENLFSRIHHLGPLREYPRHYYIWEGDHPKGVGQYGEKAIPALLSGRVQLLSIDEQIPKWLQRLELIDSYHLHPVSDTGQNYEFLVKQYKGGPEVRLTDVGFGISQILPVLICCYSAPEGSILILEQPEAHLHPKVQSELADVLIDIVKNRNVQIILESHSENLLLRLMRRIAEEEISVDQTALYFCQINDGTSEIERLDMDQYGNIRNWPQDFFGDATGELIKKTKAEMQRRKVIE